MPTVAKVQFNVYLPPELVRRVKHRAIDEGRSLSAFVETVLEASLTTVPDDPAADHPEKETRP